MKAVGLALIVTMVLSFPADARRGTKPNWLNAPEALQIKDSDITLSHMGMNVLHYRVDSLPFGCSRKSSYTVIASGQTIIYRTMGKWSHGDAPQQEYLRLELHHTPQTVKEGFSCKKHSHLLIYGGEESYTTCYPEDDFVHGRTIVDAHYSQNENLGTAIESNRTIHNMYLPYWVWVYNNPQDHGHLLQTTNWFFDLYSNHCYHSQLTHRVNPSLPPATITKPTGTYFSHVAAPVYGFFYDTFLRHPFDWRALSAIEDKDSDHESRPIGMIIRYDGFRVTWWPYTPNELKEYNITRKIETFRSKKSSKGLKVASRPDQ